MPTPLPKRGGLRACYSCLERVWEAAWATRIHTRRPIRPATDRAVKDKSMGPTSGAKRHAVAAWSLGLPLFLAILAGGASPTARAAKGKLELTVVDRDTGEPIPCRMHLRNAKGRPHKPRKTPSWHDHFALAGTAALELPLGEYSFELERGPEYVDRSGRFTINRFADDRKEVDLRRFVDMSSHGWWSGDLDVRRPARDIELLMQADDLHVVPLITWWNDTDEWGADSPPESLLVQFDETASTT